MRINVCYKFKNNFFPIFYILHFIILLFNPNPTILRSNLGFKSGTSYFIVLKCYDFLCIFAYRYRRGVIFLPKLDGFPSFPVVFLLSQAMKLAKRPVCPLKRAFESHCLFRLQEGRFSAPDFLHISLEM